MSLQPTKKAEDPKHEDPYEFDTPKLINDRYEKVDRRYIVAAGDIWSWLKEDPIFNLAAFLDDEWSYIVSRADAGDCSARTAVLIWVELVENSIGKILNPCEVQG